MKKYMSLVLFAHSVFALPFALIGFFLAIQTTEHTFSWTKLLLMLVCMVTARNAAMAFNRYLDRDIDALNPRTAVRDIPAGKISAEHALLFTVVNCFVFILATFFSGSFLQLYKKVYSSMPFGVRSRFGLSSDRSLPSCYK